MLNTDFHDVMTIKDKDIYLFDRKFKGKLIYTGQIDVLFNDLFGELPYRSVDLKFQDIDKEFYQEKTTVNYPNDYNFTRITEFKHMQHSTFKSNKTTILTEYPQEYIKDKNIPYYPIFTDKNKNIYQKYLNYADSIPNLYLVGRLAEYKYYDMCDIVKKALETYKNVSKL